MARLESNKKKKNNKKYAFIFLFTVTFVATLFLVGAMFKNFSPPVDVNIGGQEVADTDEYIDEFQQGDVDTRLKWIQFEDNMSESPVAKEVSNENPSDTVKNEFSENIKKSKEVKSFQEVEDEPPLPVPVYKKPVTHAQAPVPTLHEVQTRTTSTYSKVYVGFYPTLQQANEAKTQIAQSVSGYQPYVKKLNGQFIVQVGSFTDRTKAVNFKLELSDKGFPARLITE